MKYLLLILFFITPGISAFAHQDHLQQNGGGTRTIYTCPMHPEVQSNVPGKCPKCGMALVKKTIRTATPKPASPPAKKPVRKAPVKKTVPVSKPPARPAEKVPAKTDTVSREVDHSAHEPAVSEEIVIEGMKVDMQPGRTVRYDLYITDTVVNYTGRSRHAYAINGTIPGPDLVFTEGDTAEIYLHNRLKKEETSLHWHGVILPNWFDGVPYLTTAPVHPGDIHLYKFRVVQNGTYWYHSHSGLQEQAGIYGALIFKKRPGQEDVDGKDENMNPPAGHEEHHMHNDSSQMEHHMDKTAVDSANNNDHAAHEGHDMNMEMQDQDNNNIPVADGSYNQEYTVVLSEWTDEDPDQVQRRLRTANDWYAIKKGSTQSYSEAIRQGYFKTKLTNEWKRMLAMDVSDVYYDRFLVNGRPESNAPGFRKGDRVRLRLVNAGASSYFWVQYAGGKITVIGNDGNDVVPVEVDRLIIGVSETYDVVVTIPEDMSYEFRATPEDRTKAASLWLGSGMKMPAPVLPRLKYFEGMKMMNDMMKMNGDMKDMGMKMSMQEMDMNSVMYEELNATTPDADSMAVAIDDGGHQHHGNTTSTGGITTLNYTMLRANEKTFLPDVPVKELYFTLTGNMNRYVWSINNKVLKEWDKILIEKGHNVRIILFNNSMMRHPMHLHGHDFRIINGQGEYAPLKNVLDIMPMETDTIEFAGSQDGDWFFHCHILYHMMAGMGNVFRYNNSLPNPDLPDKVASYNKFLRHERMFHPMAEIGLESNGSDGMFMISGERYEFRTEWRVGLKAMHGYEVESYIGRYLGNMQWWFPFIGFDYHRNTEENMPEKNAFGQLSNQNNRKAFMAGVEYTLPLLFRAQARVDTDGKFRFQLGREDIPLTPRLRLNLLGNTDKEYMAGLRYILKKWFALSTHYDSDMGFGAGVTVIY